MPLPFILLGAAVIAGGFGVKKGVDAKSDFDEAESLNRETRRIYDSAMKNLEAARSSARISLETLGTLKFNIYKDSLIPFVETFSKIKNIDFQDGEILGDLSLGVTSTDMLAVADVSLKMQDVITGGIGSLGAGGLAGLAAYGGIGLLGTASTGTAIGGLTGIAATNATLAWLGGGSLAAGGFGMAGGMAVLGGIVAGPVLAVGGMMLASKAQEAKENAYSNRHQANTAAEQMKTAQVVTEGIQVRVQQIIGVLRRLDARFTEFIESLQKLVESSTDYRSYSESDKKGVMIAAMLAKTIKNAMEAPVLDEQGSITVASRHAVQESEITLQKLIVDLGPEFSTGPIYGHMVRSAELGEWYGSD